MKQLLRKGLLFAVASLALSTQMKADKGMWLLNELTKENIAQMKELGFRLPIDSLYKNPQPERVALLGWGYVKKKEGERASSQGSVAGLA